MSVHSQSERCSLFMGAECCSSVVRVFRVLFECCSSVQQCCLPIFGKIMGFGAKIRSRRRRRRIKKKCWRLFRNIFLVFWCMIVLVVHDCHHWCTQVTKFWSILTKNGSFEFCSHRPGPGHTCLFTTQLWVFRFVCSWPCLLFCCSVQQSEQCSGLNVRML